MGWLIVLGFLAGGLSTVASMGGGVLMMLTLSLWIDPVTALAMTAPALVVGNLHRVFMYRRAIDKRFAGVFIAGGFPGAFLGALVTIVIPDGVISWIVLLMCGLAIARAYARFTWTPGPKLLAPAGFVSGAAAAACGSGVFVPPLLMSAGLRSEALLATIAASGTAIHLGRLAGYGAGGMLDSETFLLASALLAASQVAGNLVGSRVRARLSDRVVHRAAYAAMLLMAGLAIAGVT